MNDTEFFEFCLDAYKHERDEADRLYTKMPIGITANMIIGGAIVYLLTGDYVGYLFTRIDAFAYYTAATITAALTAASIICLALSIVPRQYKHIGLPHMWAEWRKVAEAKMRATSDAYTDAQLQEYISEHTRAQLMNQLCQAAFENRQVSERRSSLFFRAICLTLVSLIPLLIQGIFLIILWFQFHSVLTP